MRNNRRPVNFAEETCEMMMGKFDAEMLPPKGHFHYHQGIFLSGVYQTYLLCKKEAFMDYIKRWVDSCLNEDGSIKYYDPLQLDDIQPGILLYPLLDWTGDCKYQKTLDILAGNLLEFPKNSIGGFWHKGMFPNQMWLDGLYMAGPIAAEYGKRFYRPEFTQMVVEQALLMREKTRDSRTGLYYHAYDDSKEAEWADRVTGLSEEFWGRSIGWIPVAVLDDLDFIDEGTDGYKELRMMVQELLHAVRKYQVSNGMWYQVVDKAGKDGNWPEVSCTCLFVAAMCKGVRKGILPKDYLEAAEKGYEAVIARLSWDENGRIQIGGVCIGTGVGDYEHYCKRPVSINDLHGVGAFLLMCAEAEKVL